MADEPKDPKPLRKVVYPFPKTDNSDPAHPKPVEIKDAQEYFQALSKAEDGFYPIGYNGQWHGGIHFGVETGTALAQDDGIRCIADGEVIAYRMDGDAYPTVEYTTCAAAAYSKGFVLVRHRLQPPPAPRASQATTANAGSAEDNSDTADASEQQAEPSLVLYSLYMHLRYWKAYRDDPELKRPAFWDDTVYLAGNRAIDSDRNRNPFIPESGGTGMNLRDASNEYAGFAPRGVKLKMGAANPAHQNYFEITQVVEGTTYQTGDDAVGLYVYKGTASSREGLDPLGEPRKKDGTVYVLPSPIEIKAGDLIGHLGEYQRYGDMNPMSATCTERPLVQVDVFAEPTELEEFIKKSRTRDAQLDAKQKTLLHIQPGAQFVQPAEPDVEVPAGESVLFVGDDASNRWIKGRRGTVQTVERASLGNITMATRTYPNGSIFISAINPTDGSELTLEQFNALADKSPYSQRKVLTPTTEVWLDRSVADRFNTVPTPARVWSQFPLQVSNASGDAAEHSRIMAIKSAEATSAEPDGTRWFLADAGGGATDTLQGWVREKDHPKVVLCSPWAWPGFVLLDTSSLQPQDLYARTLTQTNQDLENEREQLEALSQNAERSPLFDSLCKAIDTDGEDGITPLELRNALEKPWLAQALSRLAIKHPIEWAGPMDRWNAIDALIPAANKEDWAAEKNRIKELQIWDDVKGKNGFPDASKVAHLHPIGFAENFSKLSNQKITVNFLERVLDKPGTWFNGKGSTSAFEENFKNNYPEVYHFDKNDFVDILNSALERYEITGDYHMAHFLSQCFHECAHFESTLEFSSGRQYDPGNHEDAEENENTEIGDGPKYRGRGLIQITWKKKYREYGEYRGIDFITNPDLIAEDMYNAIDASCWFWRNKGGISKKYNAKGDINILVDNEKNNVDLITLAVNGRDNGISDRIKIFKKIKQEWGLE